MWLSDLLPGVVVGEETAQLALSERASVVGDLVAGQHLDPHGLYVAGVQCPAAPWRGKKEWSVNVDHYDKIA